MSFGPQKVEKKLRKRKKTRKRLRLRDQMFHVAINEKKKQLEISDFRLSKEKYANFIKSILSSSSKMLLSSTDKSYIFFEYLSWSTTKFDGSWKQSFILLSPTRDQQYLMSPYIITTELILEPGAHYLGS